MRLGTRHRGTRTQVHGERHVGTICLNPGLPGSALRLATIGLGCMRQGTWVLGMANGVRGRGIQVHGIGTQGPGLVRPEADIWKTLKRTRKFEYDTRGGRQDYCRAPLERSQRSYE